MKVIDLLNKIAKGEEVPRKIKWDEEEFIYGTNRIYRNEDDEPLVYNLLPSGENLNDEVEVLEEVEDKEYEELEELEIQHIEDTQHLIMKDTINALIRNQKKILEQLNKEGNNE